MTQRLLALSAYFLRSLTLSLNGLLYLILLLVYWRVMFAPDQRTPEASYYIFVVAAFGAGMTFLSVLAIASRANQAAHAPWIARLPSRVEYLTAVLLAALLFSTSLQLMLALLALLRGPDLSLAQLLLIPPVWVALNILTAVLTLHATDFVTAGWSRVLLFGFIALCLIGQSWNSSSSLNNWLIQRLSTLSRTASGEGWLALVTLLNRFIGWLQQDGPDTLSRLFSLPFWPFRAIADAIVNGRLNAAQAMAPAVLLLYATLLIMLAADLFANKDLDLTE
jgi:hypothetical protein